MIFQRAGNGRKQSGSTRDSLGADKQGVYQAPSLEATQSTIQEQTLTGLLLLTFQTSGAVRQGPRVLGGLWEFMYAKRPQVTNQILKYTLAQ